MIATILLLALTVTLFGAIFAFVTSFPSPPPQSNNQFQASLFYPTNGTVKYVAGIRIVHLAGPATPGNALIFLKSANQPSLSIFQKSYTVSTQLGASFWNLGQTLNITFPTTTLPLAGGNITVYIVSQSTLLFSVILPGTSFSAPPTVVSTYIVPATPVINQAFTVYASLSGAYNPHSVFVNLAGVPGATSTPQPMTQNAQGLWYFPVSAGASKNGTYYAYVNATSSTGSGQTAVGAVVIIITNSAGSGGGPITVGVVAVPQPPSVVVATNYFAAVISYTGSAQKAPMNVSFWVNQTPQSPFAGSHKSTHLWGPPTGLTISGPSTATVYSNFPVNFANWILNSSTWMNASVSIKGVGSANGTSLISTPNYIPGVITLLPGTPTGTTSPTSTCYLSGSHSAGTYCPFLNLTVWDNWTSSFGFPSGGVLKFSGVAYVVYGGVNGTNTQSYTISSTTISASPTVVNVVTGTTSGTTRWQPKVNLAWVASVTLSVTLTVGANTYTADWIFDNLTGTA